MVESGDNKCVDAAEMTRKAFANVVENSLKANDQVESSFQSECLLH